MMLSCVGKKTFAQIPRSLKRLEIKSLGLFATLRGPPPPSKSVTHSLNLSEVRLMAPGELPVNCVFVMPVS